VDFALSLKQLFSNYALNFVQGALLTLQITIIVMIGGTIIGTVGAIAKLSRNSFFRGLTSVYVTFFRNTPVLVQLFIVYFGFPSIGIDFEPYSAALITLIINAGAYCTEDIRAGIQSVNVTQFKSAYSLGMNKLQTYRYIVFPQAFRIIYSPLTSRFILTMLGSSIVAAISVKELTYQTMIVGGQSFRSFEAFSIAGLGYLVIAQILTLIFRFGGRFILLTKSKR
jgi:polar amino acid transport system permease protein